MQKGTNAYYNLDKCLNMLIIIIHMFFEGFDNNGVMTGPRSTRQSNPEEHASHYFNTFSKDMLVQVRFQEKRKYRSPQKMLLMFRISKNTLFLLHSHPLWGLCICSPHLFPTDCPLKTAPNSAKDSYADPHTQRHTCVICPVMHILACDKSWHSG